MQISIEGTPYGLDEELVARCKAIADQVIEMRKIGTLSPDVLHRIRKFFKIKNIYHSNAIEGNQLDVGETRLVVEQGLTISGKPLRDQAEAKNLSEALDYLEELATKQDTPITESDIRQLHYLVLKGVQDTAAGTYRTSDVEISGSAYKPPGHSSIPAEMQKFGSWLQRASVPGKIFNPDDAIVAATAAHTWFVTIHPFIDGNGRVARLVMNLMLMRYGFPISVISRDDRLRYYDALEISQASDLTALVSLVVESVEESLEEYQAAANEQRADDEWARSIAKQFAKKEEVSASNRYEVWKSAMDLLKSQFRQTVELVNQNTNFASIYFVDFGIIEFEKYASLLNRISAKKTWFFRMDFKSGDRSARYLFFFSYPSFSMRSEADVTLMVSRETPTGSFKYERLEVLTGPDVPSVLEVGYNQKSESFLSRSPSGLVRAEKVDELCRRFITEVAQKNFGG